ncbi:PREDICTED: uncharacterized protein LOC107097222 isoform X1 [Cyprinodon variegatus]|uniref:uncharacterized protein LOC107097222 isoform X1 n=1 Tax=Cyprinodon variegatus TaxID=28743 RepID=UPI00074281AA|nr:PREDICTED: uncharacterized protein LOC107097222 isoform X1 [Cyprinodon variegatus]
MANNTTTQASYIQGDPQEDDCRENVPPSDPNAMDSSKLEKAELSKVEIFTSQLEEENGNVFDARVFSTPAAKNENSAGQVKSRVSVFQSALTPILKYLNIGNKSSSPESLQNQRSHNFAVPFNIPSTNSEKSTTELRRVVNVGDCSMIINECLPEITLLDVTADSMIQLTTNDSVLPESKSSTPQFYGERKPTQTSSTHHRNNPLELSPLTTDHLRKVEDSSESTQNILDDYLREITLLDVTRDSEFSPVGQMSSMDITPVFSPAGHLKAVEGSADSTEQIMTELGKSDTITNEEMSSTSGSSVQCSQQKQAPSEVTQDISMSSTLENISSSSWASGQKVEKSQNPNEGTRVINITQDLNSSEDTPAQHVGISSASIGRSIPELDSKLCEKPDSVDMEELQTICVTKVSSNRSPQSREAETDGQEMMKCQNSDESSLCSQSINTTHEINPCCDASAQAANDLSSETDKSIPELKSEIKGNPDSVDAKIIEPPLSCESTGKESEQSLKSDTSSNGTFTIEQPSNNTNNGTVDLPMGDASEQNDVTESGDQQSSGTTKTQASFVVNQSSSAGKEGTFLIGQNATFDKDSLQKSKIISTFEKTPACLGHRNDTFECKPGSKPNGTVILSEISSSNIPQSTLGNATPPKASNSTRTLNESGSEDDSPKLQGKETTAAVEPDAKKDGSPERTSEANPALEPANASDGCEIKDLSRSLCLELTAFLTSQTIKAWMQFPSKPTTLT